MSPAKYHIWPVNGSEARPVQACIFLLNTFVPSGIKYVNEISQQKCGLFVLEKDKMQQD
jgi:hypothetical protein